MYAPRVPSWPFQHEPFVSFHHAHPGCIVTPPITITPTPPGWILTALITLTPPPGWIFTAPITLTPTPPGCTRYSRKLERLLDKYAGNERELFAKLRAKYIDNKSDEADDKGSEGADAKTQTKAAGAGDKKGDGTTKESESTSSETDSEKDKSKSKKEL